MKGTIESVLVFVAMTFAMAVAFTIDMLTDFAITAFEMFCLPFSLVHSAARLGMIDMEKLRAK